MIKAPFQSVKSRMKTVRLRRVGTHLTWGCSRSGAVTHSFFTETASSLASRKSFAYFSSYLTSCSLLVSFSGSFSNSPMPAGGGVPQARASSFSAPSPFTSSDQVQFCAWNTKDTQTYCSQPWPLFWPDPPSSDKTRHLHLNVCSATIITRPTQDSPYL